ncbi:uncharacterized protein LOC119738351 isoform X1 [Patiria miniata]|uniref:Reverse transcriptase domain-containing protein n=1 Tax=Patiria miniata TaxID=46514 RepID=A0A914B0W9_PATMI|nr:uncharacterized protein LOC119738351 isoform X1 [Patiria miniata]
MIPFYETPPHTPNVEKSKQGLNNRSAINNSEFVTNAISDLLETHCVLPCTEQPYIVNPLSVSVQKSGKRRLILDLREVNRFLWKLSVKYEDMRTAMLYLQKGGFMFQFDLKSGYHHISIRTEHQQYLGFSWFYKGAFTFFKFTVLPFGLSAAPYVFTKVVRPLVQKWRSEGKQIVVFLDDGLCYAESFQKAREHSAQVKVDLVNAGFVPNVQKSTWDPVSETEWLGLIIDLKNGSLVLPNRRINSIKERIQELLTPKSADSGIQVLRQPMRSPKIGQGKITANLQQ